MKNPWFKFYPSDWRSDEQLRNCSISARGLWIEMLCLMHKATPYGHLLINGEVPTTTQLAMQTGTPEIQIPDLIGELEKSGVFSRNALGVVFSRKMVRAEKLSKEGEKHVKKRGPTRVPISPPIRGPSPQNPSPDPDLKNPPLPPNGRNFNSGGFDILNLISEDGLMDARSHAPGWDIQGYLVPIYNSGVSKGDLDKPRKPDKAFPAWCKSFTKGKSPSGAYQ